MMWLDLLHNYLFFCKISLKFVKEIWNYCIYIKLSIFWIFTILPIFFEHVQLDKFFKSALISLLQSGGLCKTLLLYVNHLYIAKTEGDQGQIPVEHHMQ